MNIQQILGYNRPDAAYIPTPELATSDYVGVELELEGAPFRLERGHVYDSIGGVRMPVGVTAHEDGSLRNNGIEFVTAPLCGLLLREAVYGIVDVSRRLDLRESGRAGLHIHINVLDLDIKQWVNFLKVYTLTEPLIYQWVGAGRRESIYCRPWYSVDGMDANIRSFLPLLERGLLPRLNSRYYGLNINSTHKHGTLEFRHMPDTLDASRILKWISIVQLMKQYAKHNTLVDDEVYKTSPLELASRVFGRMYPEMGWGEYESWYYQHTIPFYRAAFGPPTGPSISWEWGKAASAVIPNAGYMRFMERRKKKEEAEFPKPSVKKKAVRPPRVAVRREPLERDFDLFLNRIIPDLDRE